MGSTQGETNPNIPDISMGEIGDGFGESKTEENWDETGTCTPYLICESSVVQNDIDSEDSLTVVDEAEFEGKEIADSSEKGELDLSGEQVQLEGEKNSTNKEGSPDTDDNKIVTIGKMNGGNMYRVPVKVQGKTVLAIVDTAAEVTRISEELYQGLKNSPPIISETVMNTAGKGMQMNGYIVGPVSIKLGSQTFTTNVYVAPIFDDMLLGFDFLKGNGIDICMSQGHMGV